MSDYFEHSQTVNKFFEECRRTDPVRYATVCAKYPVMSNKRISLVKKRECSVGLLGLQPSAIPIEISSKYEALVEYED